MAFDFAGGDAARDYVAALELQRLLLRDFVRHFAHFFVDQAVGGQDDRAAQAVWLAGEIADFAAGFFHQQHPRGGVPGLQAKFPETFEAAAGDAGEVQSGGAVAAHAVGVHGEVAVIAEIGAGFAIVDGKTGAEQAGGKRRNFGDVDFFSVEGGALAARGGEELLEMGL